MDTYKNPLGVGYYDYADLVAEAEKSDFTDQKALEKLYSWLVWWDDNWNGENYIVEDSKGRSRKIYMVYDWDKFDADKEASGLGDDFEPLDWEPYIVGYEADWA